MDCGAPLTSVCSLPAAQAQLGPTWKPLSGLDVLHDTAELQLAGALLPLEEPIISIQACGRPRGKLNAQESERLKSFWEQVGELEKLAALTVEQARRLSMRA